MICGDFFEPLMDKKHCALKPGKFLPVNLISSIAYSSKDSILAF